MNESLPASFSPFCHADPRCDRVALFQARLDVVSADRCVHECRELCSHHLGDSVYALAIWARGEGLEGEVTVFAIDLSGPVRTFPAWSRSRLAFGSIPIGAT